MPEGVHRREGTSRNGNPRSAVVDLMQDWGEVERAPGVSGRKGHARRVVANAIARRTRCPS